MRRFILMAVIAAIAVALVTSPVLTVVAPFVSVWELDNNKIVHIAGADSVVIDTLLVVQATAVFDLIYLDLVDPDSLAMSKKYIDDQVGGGGGSDSSLFLTEAVGTGTRTIFWSNDTLFFKIGADTVMIMVDNGTQTKLSSFDNTNGFLFVSDIDLLNQDIVAVRSVFADTIQPVGSGGTLVLRGAVSGSIEIVDDPGTLRWTFEDNRMTGAANSAIILDSLVGISGTITTPSRIFINANTNQHQFIIQANGTQDSNLFIIEASDGTDLIFVDDDGELNIDHVASHLDSRAFKVMMDAAGIGGSAGIDLDLTTGAIIAGEEVQGLIININQDASTGGDVVALSILTTTTGSAISKGGFYGVGVNPILHESGDFVNLTFAEKRGAGAYVDWVTNANTRTTDETLWEADNDTVFVGFATIFEELEWIFETVATKDLLFNFFYSVSGPSWTSFTPIDGTDGATKTGIMAWSADDIPGWASVSVDGDAAFWIAIVRTKNSATGPTEDLVQIAAPVNYEWDEDGNIKVNSVQIDSMSSFSGSKILATDYIFYGDSTVAGSTSVTQGFVQREIEDSLNEYSLTTAIVLTDGSNALTANWAAGNFKITGLDFIEIDSIGGLTGVKLNIVDSVGFGTDDHTDFVDKGVPVATSSRVVIEDSDNSVNIDSIQFQLMLRNVDGTVNNRTALGFSTTDGSNTVWAAGIIAQTTARTGGDWTTTDLGFYTGLVSDNPLLRLTIEGDGDVLSAGHDFTGGDSTDWSKVLADRLYALPASGDPVLMPRVAAATTGHVLKVDITPSGYDSTFWAADNTGGAADTALVLAEVTDGDQILKWSVDSLLIFDDIVGTQNITIKSNADDRLIIRLDSIHISADIIGDFAGDALSVTSGVLNVGGLLDAQMANDAMDADKILLDVIDDNFLDVTSGGTGAGTFVLGELLLGNSTGDIQGSGVLGVGVLVIGDNVGNPNFAVMSADATITSSGALTIEDDAIQESDLEITNAGSAGNVLSQGAGDDFTWIAAGGGVDSSLYVDSIMVAGNTETGITVTMNTIDTTMDFVVSVTGGSSAEIVDNSVTMADDMNTFTEAEIETQLSDVTALFTNNVTGDVTVAGATSTIGANVIDSTNIADGDLTVDDINWRIEYMDLSIVHGYSPADSTHLTLPVFEGFTPILFVDSTNEASAKDTVIVSGTVPYEFTVDSLIIGYKVTGTSVLIDSLVLVGPDKSAFTNNADSTYFSSGTNRTSTSFARLGIDMTNFTARAGDRFAVQFSMDLAADDGTVKVYYIQLAGKR